MKPTFYLLLLIAYSSINCFSQSPCKEIVGYYPNWQWYDRSKLVNPKTLDYSKYTIINYAFLKPEMDGTISLTDSWADQNLLLGENDWQNGGYIPNTSLIDLAHQNNVKVLPSIGGWTLSNNFPSIAEDPIKRSNFVNACIQLINTYNFDGIDLDWEYPGYSPHSGTISDKENFSLLLVELRSALNDLSNQINKPLLLTAAVGAAQAHMNNIDWNIAQQNLDIINLMSYDFFGTWNSLTNHNSPLYAPSIGDPYLNIDAAANLLVNEYQVDPGKITIGVAFYGRSFKTTSPPSLHSTHLSQSDLITFSQDEGTPLYYNILNNYDLFNEHWDSYASVPYLTGKNDLNTFVSFDNATSIAKKATYIMENQFAGAIIWEITGDYIETYSGSGIIKNTPLVDTLNAMFCNYNVVTHQYPKLLHKPINIYPNPASSNFYITNDTNSESIKIQVYTQTGILIKVLQFNHTNHVKIDFNEPAGVYFVKVTTDHKDTFFKLLKID